MIDQVSHETLRRQTGGLVAGREIPGFVTVSVEVDEGMSREKARTELQAALSDLGRGDIEVVNA